MYIHTHLQYILSYIYIFVLYKYILYIYFFNIDTYVYIHLQVYIYFCGFLTSICAAAHLWSSVVTDAKYLCAFFMSEGQGIVTFKAHGGKRMFKHGDMKGRIDQHIYGLTSRSIIHSRKCHWCHSLQAGGANWCSCSWTRYFCWQKNLRWCWTRIQRSCRWSEGRCSRRPGSLQEHKAVSEWRDAVGLGYLWGKAKSGKPLATADLEDQGVNSWNTNTAT